MYLKDSCSTHFTLEITPKEMATLCMCLTSARHTALRDVCTDIYNTRLPDEDEFDEMERIVGEVNRQTNIVKDVCDLEVELQEIMRNDYP